MADFWVLRCVAKCGTSGERVFEEIVFVSEIVEKENKSSRLEHTKLHFDASDSKIQKIKKH